MPCPTSENVAVISGLGNARGVGAATARAFSSQLGYKVALISRPRQEITELKNEIESWGGVAEIFSVEEYERGHIEAAFARIAATWPAGRIKFALWNTGAWSRIPFLDIKESDIQRSTAINIVAATAFSQCAVRAFIAPASSEEIGGTLIFTGATSATRGAHSFGAFSAGKSGLRALSQSIAREFGPQGVHVSFVIVDGVIVTKRTLALFGAKEGKETGWMQDKQQSMTPESIAKAYLYLHSQDPGCWTLEMDLRPAKEHF